MRRRRIIMAAGGGGILPPEYQQVLYIEGTGQQYIDSGVRLSSSDLVKCRFAITSPTAALADAIYGSLSSGNFFVLLMRSPNQARVGTSSNQVSSTNLVLNQIYDTSLTNGVYAENGITYTFTPSTAFTSSLSCYVMFRNQAAQILPVSAKVYSFEVAEKFNGIPCYRKADNKPGLYDIINNVFHTNANPSAVSDFIVGPDVN